MMNHTFDVCQALGCLFTNQTQKKINSVLLQEKSREKTHSHTHTHTNTQSIDAHTIEN